MQNEGDSEGEAGVIAVYGFGLYRCHRIGCSICGGMGET